MDMLPFVLAAISQVVDFGWPQPVLNDKGLQSRLVSLQPCNYIDWVDTVRPDLKATSAIVVRRTSARAKNTPLRSHSGSQQNRICQNVLAADKAFTKAGHGKTHSSCV